MFKWLKKIKCKKIKWPELPDPTPIAPYLMAFGLVSTLIGGSCAFLLNKVEHVQSQINGLNYQVELLKERGHEENIVISGIIGVEETLVDNADSLRKMIEPLRQKTAVTKDICKDNQHRLQKIHTPKTVIDRYYADCIKHIGG